MLAILKKLFLDVTKVSKKSKKLLLYTSLFMMFLNVLGIYRNSYTLWLHKDFMSYLWLGMDILQLLFCTLMFFVVYLGDKFSYRTTIILMVSSVVFAIMNMYNFLVNFYWLKIEGILVFLFWFLNNGAMVLFPALVLYLIVSGRFSNEKKT